MTSTISFIFFIMIMMFLLRVEGYNGDPYRGLILLAENKDIRSGVLSADHRCQEYPDKFPASRITNRGKVHCTLWTEDQCQGSLYVIPAHYEMPNPEDISFKSVIC
ncbi:uncharacterized protein BX664DRAFT_311896 [Halteromyces radiatus]|uniref:uncharacterized protein n=1 Tax=Halteromyces radiatus TaxID=101107 RepID=UPI00221FBEAF|nr:uncharacterized protein BX664DRAFT_311896 [Halteromyces radiatus]KAI8097008.1 hypothetical protein BX664DRAFT_311896 [Halteromyces radiatus]